MSDDQLTMSAFLTSLCPDCSCGPKKVDSWVVINTGTLVCSCVGLVCCAYTICVFVIFRNHRVQTRRITMLVLVADMLTSVSLISVSVGNQPGGYMRSRYTHNDGNYILENGIRLQTPGACFAAAFEVAALYTSGVSQLIMVMAMNLIVVLEKSEIGTSIEKGLYGISALLFISTLIAATTTCSSTCLSATDDQCYELQQRWDEFYFVVAGTTIVAYCIAGIRLLQRRRWVRSALASSRGGGTFDENGGFVPMMRTKAERFSAERVAGAKLRAYRDAVLVFAPYTIGFIISASGQFRLGMLWETEGRSTLTVNTEAFQASQMAMYLLISLQPVLNVGATLVQRDFREQLAPKAAWQRLKRRMRRRRKGRVRIQSMKMGAFKLIDDGGTENVTESVKFSVAGADGVHGGDTSSSSDIDGGSYDSDDADISYAAASAL